jgi:hypothetical protein
VFVVPYFEVFEEHNRAFEEHNKALIEVVDRIDSVDFGIYYQFVVERPIQYLYISIDPLKLKGFRYNRGTRQFEISSRTGTQK